MKTITDLVILKISTNKVEISAFVVIGILLKVLGFDFDKDSYQPLFITLATITATLVGFISIFVIFRIEQIRDKRNYIIGKVEVLKNGLVIHKKKILIVQYIPDNIKSQIETIDTAIKEIDQRIEAIVKKSINPEGMAREPFKLTQEDISYVSDRQILAEIKYNLELLFKSLSETRNFSYKDSFLFAMFVIFLFMIPIALNHIHFLDVSYKTFFDYFKLVKMPLSGLLFGLFFIVLKEISYILNEILNEAI